MEADRLLKAKEFLGEGKSLPISLAHWYALMQEGRAPRPVKLGRTSVWRESDIRRIVAGTWKPNEEAA